MSLARKHREDLTYAEQHRHKLPELYGKRVGHRFHQADRDWTEVCSVCREPLLLIEEHRDVGQDLLDKGTTITRKLAERAHVEAWQVAWRTDRSAGVQDEIDQLGRRITALEQLHPITGFSVRRLYRASPRRLIHLTPEQWWAWIALHHRRHHGNGCPTPHRHPSVRWERFYPIWQSHPLNDGRLWLDDAA